MLHSVECLSKPISRQNEASSVASASDVYQQPTWRYDVVVFRCLEDSHRKLGQSNQDSLETDKLFYLSAWLMAESQFTLGAPLHGLFWEFSSELNLSSASL